MPHTFGCQPQRWVDGKSTNTLFLKYTAPDEGVTSPVIMLNVVVFPAPFTPRSPKHCDKDTKNLASTPYALLNTKLNFATELHVIYNTGTSAALLIT